MHQVAAGDQVLELWNEAARRGVLRTSPDSAQWRKVEGSLGVLVLFNPSHQTHKRPVAAELLHVGLSGSSSALAAPAALSSAGGFNFCKAKPDEFLCGLRTADEASGRLIMEPLERTTDHEFKPPQHAVLVNVSPLMRGHLLCVFDLMALRPQVLALDMIEFAVQVGSLMAHEDFYLGFNSVGAWSSVNHCHFQGYWMGKSSHFPITIQPRETLFHVACRGKKIQMSRVVDWPMHCLAIEGALGESEEPSQTSATACVASVTWEIVHCLQKKCIPYNLLFAYYPRLVVFVFPRQVQQENGVDHFSSESSPAPLRFAVAEVSGVAVASSEIAFRGLTEDIYVEIMRNEVSLATNSFSQLITELQAQLQALTAH